MGIRLYPRLYIDAAADLCPEGPQQKAAMRTTRNAGTNEHRFDDKPQCLYDERTSTVEMTGIVSRKINAVPLGNSVSHALRRDCTSIGDLSAILR